MKSPVRRQYEFFPKGLTLIELLVVFGAIIIVGSIGVFYFRGFGRRQTVTQAAETLRTQLTRVRQKALAGERPSACPISNALESYRFSWDSTSYSVTPQCGGAILPTTTQLPANVTLAASVDCPASGYLEFGTLARGTDLTNDCLLTLSGAGSTASLTIKKSGNIE